MSKCEVITSAMEITALLCEDINKQECKAMQEAQEAARAHDISDFKALINKEWDNGPDALAGALLENYKFTSV